MCVFQFCIFVPTEIVMQEIERKFLVKSNDFIAQSHKKHKIVQGYLNSNPERSVRIRIKDNKAFITVKGMGNTSGVSRFEWEKEIDVSDAEKLLLLCEPVVIDKVRHDVFYEGFLYEIDVFYGANEGLVLAEIELENENQLFAKPEWLADEVTGKEQYYNAYLSRFPYKKIT